MDKESLKALTRDQIDLLKRTFRLLDTDSVAKRFYTTLFSLHPEVKPLFPTDLTELSTKLISVFELVVFSFKEQKSGLFFLQDDVAVALRSLGKKHSDKGVINSYYPIANEILLQSMRQEAGHIFSPEAEQAWKMALAHLTAAMLSKESEGESARFQTIRESFHYIKSFFKS